MSLFPRSGICAGAMFLLLRRWPDSGIDAGRRFRAFLRSRSYGSF